MSISKTHHKENITIRTISKRSLTTRNNISRSITATTTKLLHGSTRISEPDPLLPGPVNTHITYNKWVYEYLQFRNYATHQCSVLAKSFLYKCTVDCSNLSQYPNLTVSYVNIGLTLEVIGYILLAAFDKFNKPSCALIHPFRTNQRFVYKKNMTGLSGHAKT
jgi:hypothetical protein